MAPQLPVSWLDNDAPVIGDYAQRLEKFIKAMADGKISPTELNAQENRVVALMKEIEPKLEPGLHKKVTELLCELTAYTIMDVVHAMQQARAHAFRG